MSRTDEEILTELRAICPPPVKPVRRERVCREVELSGPVCQWLREIGCTAYAEVDAGISGPIDHVGVRADESVICVQMKIGLTKKVVQQACLCQLVTVESYAAVQSKPRKSSLDWAAKVGIGVWFDGRVILEPRERFESRNYDYYRQRILKACERLTPGGDGGLPTLKGDGPAQRCAAAIRIYLAEHPSASWKQIWRDVPNHYAHYKSMRGAIMSRSLLDPDADHTLFERQESLS